MGLQVAAEEELLRQADDDQLGDDQVGKVGRQGRREVPAEHDAREGVVQQRVAAEDRRRR